ncbi:MAG: hypothetical protein SFH39_15415, partial [Candidatus Magnetobacterium sp. LHC-1]
KNIASLINKDELLLTDLGYWQFDTFYEVVQRGGYFLSRLKVALHSSVVMLLKHSNNAIL